MSRQFGLFCMLALLLVWGCSGKQELDRFQTDLTPAIGHANSMRSLIASLKSLSATEGVNGLKTELGLLDERLEEFQDANISESDRATYDKIIPKLKELAALVNSPTPNKAAISELIQEAETLAESLPKATPTPSAS